MLIILVDQLNIDAFAIGDYHYKEDKIETKKHSKR